MMERLEGRVYFVGDNIDTDAILPSDYMTSMDPVSLGPHAMEGLNFREHPAFIGEGGKSPYNIIIAGSNFGCGSSREHAPIALYGAGIQAVVAKSFARIFYRNCVNGGLILPIESLEKLDGSFKTGDLVHIGLRMATPAIFNHEHGRRGRFDLMGLGPVADIVEAGGLTTFNKRRLGLE